MLPINLNMTLKQDSLGFLVADLARLMRRAFEQRLQGGTLTLAQARTLIHVARQEGVRQIDLADAMELQPITLARLLDQLAEAGLVERRADPADRRAYRVYLLPAAQNELATIEREAATIRARALQGLDATQADATLAALRIMQRNLSGR